MKEENKKVEEIEEGLTGTDQEKKDQLEMVGVAMGMVYQKKGFLEQNLAKAEKFAEHDLKEFSKMPGWEMIDKLFGIMMGASVEDTLTEGLNMVDTLKDEIAEINEWLEEYKFDERVMKAVAQFLNFVQQKK